MSFSIKAVEKELGNEFRHFYTGVSCRHCMLWENAPGSELDERVYDFARPHDHLGKVIKETGVISLDGMRTMFEKIISAKRQNLIDVNLRTTELGYNYQ